MTSVRWGMDFADITIRFIIPRHRPRIPQIVIPALPWISLRPIYYLWIYSSWCHSLCRILKIITMEGTCNCGAISVKVNDSELFTRRRGHTCRCINCRKTSGSCNSPSFASYPPTPISSFILFSLTKDFHNSSLRSCCYQPHNRKLKNQDHRRRKPESLLRS